MNDFAMVLGNILMSNTAPLLSIDKICSFFYFYFSICYNKNLSDFMTGNLKFNTWFLYRYIDTNIDTGIMM